MKKLILISAALLLASITVSNAQTATKTKAKTTKSTTKNKDADGIDGRMKGPNGEVVFIGEKGGRYYINASGNKTYVEYGKKAKNKKAVKDLVRKLVK